MRYQLQQAGKRLGQGFLTIEEVENYIQDHLRKGGLDWRSGYAFKARDDTDFFEVINIKTGVVLKK